MQEENKPLSWDDAEKIKRALSMERRDENLTIEDHAEALIRAFDVVNRATRTEKP